MIVGMKLLSGPTITFAANFLTAIDCSHGDALWGSIRHGNDDITKIGILRIRAEVAILQI